jgi:hypothetical protein
MFFKHTGNFRAVRQLLPFWGFPGLYLLLFAPLYWHYEVRKISTLLTVLMEHGGVPHGTEIYNAINRLLTAVDFMYRDAYHIIQSKIHRLYLFTKTSPHYGPIKEQIICLDILKIMHYMNVLITFLLKYFIVFVVVFGTILMLPIIFI